MELLSKNDICNLALSYLKISVKLNIESPVSAEDIACAKWYPISRRNAIIDGQPNFARRKIYLSPIEDEEKLFDFNSVYALPDDCIKFLYAGLSATDKISVELINARLYSYNEDKLPITYMVDEENTQKYPSKFVEYFALCLACNLCMALEGNLNALSFLQNLKFKALNELRIHERQSNPPKLINRPRLSILKNTGE
jgi:hypothetical protein